MEKVQKLEIPESTISRKQVVKRVLRIWGREHKISIALIILNMVAGLTSDQSFHLWNMFIAGILFGFVLTASVFDAANERAEEEYERINSQKKAWLKEW